MAAAAAPADRAFYRREAEWLVPTGLGVSPWDPATQAGSCIAGLVGQLLDAVPVRAPMHPVRLTIDLLGAVPMAPLQARIAIPRDGPRVQLAELELYSGDRNWVKASLLRLREDGPAGPGEPPLHPLPANPAGLRRVHAESIRLSGDEQTPGSGALWMRMITGMIAGEPTAPLALVAAAADWGTAVAPPADPRHATYANLDICIHLARLPEGEWLLLAGSSEVPGNGTAITHLRIGDAHGMLATAHQSVFLQPRSPASA